jgi:[ribosomal protein S5]-alanine N-acetyltransferase
MSTEKGKGNAKNKKFQIMIFDTKIETDRLLLRRLDMTDAQDMFEYTSNPSVTKYLSWDPHEEISKTEKFIRGVINKYEFQEKEFTYGIELKSQNKLIGALKILNICNFNKRGEFTSILNPDYQGKGYMGEAWQSLLEFCFNVAGLNRIQSYVTIDNIASQKKNDRAGLIKEGHLKDWWFMKGKFKDAYIYAITKAMYESRKGKN